MKSDIEIARSIRMKKITEIAAGIGIPEDRIEQYGHYMAKVPETLSDPEKIRKSRLILVTAISPAGTVSRAMLRDERGSCRRRLCPDNAHGQDKSPFHRRLPCSHIRT